MPLADYTCPQCGAVQQDVYFPVSAGAPASAPACPHCATAMAWVVPVIAVDARASFQRFAVYRDIYEKNPESGQVERFQRREVIDSIRTMRQIEQDSERRYRNGEGEPMRFRMLSQDRSNKDVGSFGIAGKIGDQPYSSGQAPTKRAGVRVRRHGERKPTVSLGPGLRRASSPLQE